MTLPACRRGVPSRSPAAPSRSTVAVTRRVMSSRPAAMSSMTWPNAPDPECPIEPCIAAPRTMRCSGSRSIVCGPRPMRTIRPAGPRAYHADGRAGHEPACADEDRDVGDAGRLDEGAELEDPVLRYPGIGERGERPAVAGTRDHPLGMGAVEAEAELLDPRAVV